MEAGLGTGAGIHTLKPRIHVLQRGIDFLSYACAEIERAIQDDISGGEAIARDKFLAFEQVVEPLEIVLDGRLHSGRALGNQAHPALEELGAFREAKAVVEKLGDLELD